VDRERLVGDIERIQKKVVMRVSSYKQHTMSQYCYHSELLVDDAEGIGRYIVIHLVWYHMKQL